MKATRVYIEALTTALANDNKIKFVEGDKWSTDVQHKTITYDFNALLDLDIEFVKGLLLHEMSHVLYTSIETKQRPLQKQYPELQAVYNSLEDLRIEGLTIDKYADFARVPFKNLQLWCGENNLNQIAIYGNQKISLIDQFCLSFLNKIALDFSPYGGLRYVYGHPTNINSFINLTDIKVQEALDKIQKKFPNHTMAQKVRDFKDTIELQDFIDKEIFPFIKDLFDKNFNKKRQFIKMLGQVMRGAMGTITSKDKAKFPQFPTDEEIEQSLSPYINTLAQKLNDILKEQQSTRFTGNHLAGKLLSKNVYKVLTDEKRIFSKKTNPNKPLYHVYFLLDGSGSMSDNNKLENAYTASFLLSRVSKKLGFKQTFFDFSDTPRELKNLYDYRNPQGSGTDLGRALPVLEKAITKDEENIVFLVTDGMVGGTYIPENLIKIEKKALDRRASCRERV